MDFGRSAQAVFVGLESVLDTECWRARDGRSGARKSGIRDEERKGTGN